MFHTRDLLVRQRTKTINALRSHLAEFGVVAPQGPAHVDRLASALHRVQVQGCRDPGDERRELPAQAEPVTTPTSAEYPRLSP